MNKLDGIERADAIFAISQSAAQEVIEYTDIASDRVLNISSAVGEEFAVIDYSAERIQSLKDKYSLPDEFILSLAMIEPTEKY